jgi:hypothetical protein
MISFGVGSRSTGGHLPRGRCFFRAIFLRFWVAIQHLIIDCRRPEALRASSTSRESAPAGLQAQDKFAGLNLTKIPLKVDKNCQESRGILSNEGIQRNFDKDSSGS